MHPHLYGIIKVKIEKQQASLLKKPVCTTSLLRWRTLAPLALVYPRADALALDMPVKCSSPLTAVVGDIMRLSNRCKAATGAAVLVGRGMLIESLLSCDLVWMSLSLFVVRLG